MEWFGRKPNETGLWTEENEAPVPVGIPCFACEKPFEATDFGVVLPFMGGTDEPLVGKAPYHHACLCEQLGIGTRSAPSIV